LAGFLATVVLTTLLATGQGLRWTRIHIPYLVGTIFVEARARAKAVGVAVHFVFGELFALVYVATFHVLHQANALLGAAMGAVHGVFVLGAMFPLLPSVHPRMASELAGPTTERYLEPPGFFALHYGARTPVFVFVAHVIYGAIVGAIYTPV
jgi:uncharacterized membrane protein YagU involved in acid resistance